MALSFSRSSAMFSSSCVFCLWKRSSSPSICTDTWEEMRMRRKPATWCGLQEGQASEQKVSCLVCFSPLQSALSLLWYHSPVALSVSSTPLFYNLIQIWISPAPDFSSLDHKFASPSTNKTGTWGKSMQIDISYLTSVFRLPDRYNGSRQNWLVWGNDKWGSI